MICRIRYSKLGKVKFTSHRDVARIFERAIRRAGLPVSYSEGFSPRPKLSFGLALSTGHESLGEYLDVTFRPGEQVDPAGLPAELNPLLPEGIAVQAAVEIERGTDSLQAAVTSCSWSIEVEGASRGELQTATQRALQATELPIRRSRKGREITEDVRPQILAVALGADTERGVELRPELATQPRACRPAELLRALDGGLRERRVTRTQQWTQTGEGRREPIELAATPVDHASERGQ